MSISNRLQILALQSWDWHDADDMFDLADALELLARNVQQLAIDLQAEKNPAFGPDLREQ